MGNERKKLVTDLIYETYHKIAPKILKIGKDEFMLNDIGIYFTYRPENLEENKNNIVKPKDSDDSKTAVCGMYEADGMDILIILEGVLYIGDGDMKTALKRSIFTDLEILAKTTITAILIHELFHYNQKIDFTIPNQKKRQEIMEAMVYQKELEFQINHFHELTQLIGCDSRFLLNRIGEKYNAADIDDIKSNIDRVLKDSIEEMFPDTGYTPYEYTDSCNFLARYMYYSYARKVDIGTFITTENEIYNRVLEFIKFYNNSEKVELKFDMDLNELLRDNFSPPRISGYVVLKDNGKDLNEVKSIERLFNILIDPINKFIELDKKRLMKLSNKKLYNSLMSAHYSGGDYITFHTVLDYEISENEMIITLKPVKSYEYKR